MGEGPGFISTFPERSRRLSKKSACREVLELEFDKKNRSEVRLLFRFRSGKERKNIKWSTIFKVRNFQRGFIKFMITAEEHG